MQDKPKFHGPNLSSDKTLFDNASNDSYVAHISSIPHASSFIAPMTFTAWVANSLTTDQSDYMQLTSNPDLFVCFDPGTVTLKKGDDELFTTTMIQDYLYHLAVVIDGGKLEFYLNGQLMYSNSTILPDIIQENRDIDSVFCRPCVRLHKDFRHTK